MRPKLSIVMATIDDYHGTVFSIQSMRMHHDLPLYHEFVVVNDNPDSRHGQDIASFIKNNVPNSKHIAAGGLGSAMAKDRAIREATGEIVLLMDSHVLLDRDCIPKLIAYYGDHPNCDDLLTGILVYDGLNAVSTGLQNKWRGDAWGIWETDQSLAYSDSEPKEIWGQGNFLFSCRRDSWVGFHPAFTGFGGEEGYIHEKYRRYGRKVISLPFLRGWHRFGRPEGPGFNANLYERIRNYVIGLQELGLPLDECHDHFVDGKKMTQDRWERLIADPVKHTRDAEDRYMACPTCEQNKAKAIANPVPPPPRSTLDAIVDSFRDKCDNPADLICFSNKSNANVIMVELAKYPGRRMMAIIGTVKYGQHDGNNGPGLLPGIGWFLKQNLEWSVVHVSDEGDGLMILSRDERDKPQLPGMIEQIGNYAKALAVHVAGGSKLSSNEQQTARLNVCNVCEFRNDDRCSQCGCPIKSKAAWQEQKCPIDKWAEVDLQFKEETDAT